MPFSGAVMEPQRMLSLCHELADMNVFDITLAGGEPFMNPGLYDAVDLLVSRGVNLGVLSNGTLIDKPAARRLVDTIKGRDNFLLQISLDGVSAQTHNKSRKKGDAVLRNLDHICTDTDLRLQIATVITAYNIREIPRLIETYYPRVKRFHFMNLQRTSRSMRHEDLFVGEDRNEAFWAELEDFMHTMPDDILITGLNLMRLLYHMDESPEHNRMHSCFNCASCTSGITHVEITTDFTVLGCDIAKDFTAMGNVKDKSFAEVWNSQQAEKVRRYPFPACYLLKAPDGGSLADQLAPNTAAYYEDVIAPGV